MASGFFALLDDIASLLDDVAAMTKVATKKTAGVLGDDLALNANQLTGLHASRELPIIWAVSKGSLINKAILVPVALLLSALWPALVPIALMIGGAYLCFEVVEKILHHFLHRQHHPDNPQEEGMAANALDSQSLEKKKIRNAIRTDFILSAEIIVIALGSFVGQPLATQIIGLIAVALILTIAVYGTVALIVKMDDLGLYWCTHVSMPLQLVGKGLLWFAPKLLKILSIVGTAAMFIVGGHLCIENLAFLHHFEHSLIAGMAAFSAWFVTTIFSIIVGIIIGSAIYVVTESVQKIRR
ncbi:MAG: DUF808 domain-containing protein [Cardiobacteriaceae bacterium]|nr:DUF808 domain-containing protein [Cardiobacteriaceae bacterium]